SRLPHLADVLKPQVVRNQGFNLLDFFVRETQPSADALRNSRAYLYVAIEAYTRAGAGGGSKRGRLSNIMQQYTPSQRRRAIRGELLQHHARVDPTIPLGMELGRLLTPFHAPPLWQHSRKKPRLIKQLESAPGG